MTSLVRMTVDDFLVAYADREGRYELIDGIPAMMAETTARESRIRANLFASIYALLGDGPCEIFGTNMGVELTEHDFRLPDAAIYCDPADLGPDSEYQRAMKHPKVVFGVLSASSSSIDGLVKLLEYQTLPSVDTIVSIDPERRLFATIEREGGHWVQTDHCKGASLTLREPAMTLSSEAILRRVGPPT